MKKIVLIIIGLFVGMIMFAGCEADTDTCKKCKIITRDANGSIIKDEPIGTYCGDKLMDIDGKSETIGDTTAEYVCD